MVNNFSIEIFNPTDQSINLTNYSVQLGKTTGMVAIPLNGTINSKDVYVLSNTSSDNILQQLSDNLNSNLDFEKSLSVALVKNDNTIDLFGFNLNQSVNFNINTYFQNPDFYLSQNKFDLKDFKHIGLIRGNIVRYGDPSFSYGDSSFTNQWYVNYNLDKSNIGIHDAICKKPMATPYISFYTQQPGYNQKCTDISGAVNVVISGGSGLSTCKIRLTIDSIYYAYLINLGETPAVLGPNTITPNIKFGIANNGGNPIICHDSITGVTALAKNSSGLGFPFVTIDKNDFNFPETQRFTVFKMTSVDNSCVVNNTLPYYQYYIESCINTDIQQVAQERNDLLISHNKISVLNPEIKEINIYNFLGQ